MARVVAVAVVVITLTASVPAAYSLARLRLHAATLLVGIPVALVFNAFLTRFIAGFTMGAVKG